MELLLDAGGDAGDLDPVLAELDLVPRAAAASIAAVASEGLVPALGPLAVQTDAEIAVLDLRARPIEAGSLHTSVLPAQTEVYLRWCLEYSRDVTPTPFTSELAAELAPDLLDRFQRYVRIDTQSQRDRTRSPSTPGQLDLAGCWSASCTRPD